MRGCSGGCVWLLWGGMHGCSRGACVVALGGDVWLLRGGCAWLLWGGHVWLLRGACVVLFGGVGVWFYSGGMRGFIQGGMRGFFSFFGYNEKRSMSGRYASYWNAFLFAHIFVENCMKRKEITCIAPMKIDLTQVARCSADQWLPGSQVISAYLWASRNFAVNHKPVCLHTKHPSCRKAMYEVLLSFFLNKASRRLLS